MRLNLSKYSKLIKYLCILPVIVAVFSLSELVVPLKTIESQIVSKDVNHKVRFGFDHYTYTIHFNNLREQFSEEIYKIAEIGDKTLSKVTYLSDQIQEITFKKNNKKYVNSSGENYAIVFLGIFMLLAGLSWLKKQNLSNKQSKYLIFIIIFSLVYGIKFLL